MGSFQSNDAALAVLEMKSWGMLPTATKGLTLALDTVNDPGNLGTILRLADWYACDAVICSPETADMYNPKTIAASKGSFLRMPVYYTSLDEWLPKVTVPVYAALLQGASVHYATLETPAILLMGNEANGIRPHLLPLVQHPISIPRFGHAESLNVASAAAILVDRFMSRHHPPS
jgi:TrmH family RNA methyltransferase